MKFKQRIMIMAISLGVGVFASLVVAYIRGRKIEGYPFFIQPKAKRQPNWQSKYVTTLLNQRAYTGLNGDERAQLALQLVLTIISPYMNDTEAKRSRDLIRGALIGLKDFRHGDISDDRQKTRHQPNGAEPAHIGHLK